LHASVVLSSTRCFVKYSSRHGADTPPPPLVRPTCWPHEWLPPLIPHCHHGHLSESLTSASLQIPRSKFLAPNSSLQIPRSQMPRSQMPRSIARTVDAWADVGCSSLPTSCWPLVPRTEALYRDCHAPLSAKQSCPLTTHTSPFARHALLHALCMCRGYNVASISHSTSLHASIVPPRFHRPSTLPPSCCRARSVRSISLRGHPPPPPPHKAHTKLS